MMLETSQPGVFTAGDVRSGSVNSSRSPVLQAPTNAGAARGGLKLLPDAAVTESEAGGGAKPWLPLPMGQLAQPFPPTSLSCPLGYATAARPTKPEFDCIEITLAWGAIIGGAP